MKVDKKEEGREGEEEGKKRNEAEDGRRGTSCTG